MAGSQGLVWSTELAAGEIARAMPEVSFGAVSQHLRVLREAGLVEVRRDGRFRRYRARQAAFGSLADYLTARWAERLERLQALAQAYENSQ